MKLLPVVLCCKSADAAVRSPFLPEGDPNDPGLARILREAVRHDFPVNLLCWGNLDAGTALIDRPPDTRFIIDHRGILQPRTPPAPPQPWASCRKLWTSPSARTR